MFERYTEDARRTLFFSRYEASQHGSSLIAPEHLLLGIIHEAETASVGRLFSAAGLTLAGIRSAVEATLRFQEDVPVSVEIPFPADAKRVLQRAAEEADALEHESITAEHLLLGILREDLGGAAKLLNDRGLFLSDARTRIAPQG